MDKAEVQMFYRFFTEIGIIHQLGRAVIEARFPSDITTTHFGVLGHLMRRPDGQTPLDLATAFQVPKTTMTHMIKVLVRHGYVEVTPHPEDGRSKLVRTTEAGKAFISESMVAMAPEFGTLVDRIGADAVEALLPGLARIRETMDAMRDP
ncbi:MAG: MarR family transcriptional regulator [Pseudomonadota bacterium]